MTVSVAAQVHLCFSLSLELLSYQKLPADQMLPGVDIMHSACGEREMVFTQSLRLEYSKQTAQASAQAARGMEGEGRAKDKALPQCPVGWRYGGGGGMEPRTRLSPSA